MPTTHLSISHFAPIEPSVMNSLVIIKFRSTYSYFSYNITRPIDSATQQPHNWSGILSGPTVGVNLLLNLAILVAAERDI